MLKIKKVKMNILKKQNKRKIEYYLENGNYEILKSNEISVK